MPGDDELESETDDAEDLNILSRLRAGDRQTFADLVRKHRAGIQRLVRGYVKTDEEAEDLTQQAFMKALRSIATFRGDASFRTWLHRIAVNAALNHARDQRRAPTVSIEEADLITNALGTGRMAARGTAQARRGLGPPAAQAAARRGDASRSRAIVPRDREHRELQRGLGKGEFPACREAFACMGHRDERGVMSGGDERG